MNYQLIVVLISSFLISTCSLLTASADPPVELGKVDWLRDFDKGIALSKKQQKPVFLLFQEVPGCATCKNYGKNVLSHPLIVDAIENLFVPVAIFNNKGGEDAKILKLYGEPSWNNPVVRIVDEKQKDIVKRVGSNYSQLGIVQAMVHALQAKNIAVPTYLDLLEKELLAKHSKLETANLSMYCFWTGEKQLGKIDGVVETQPGFMGGREVVQVKYDRAIVNYEKLVKKAVATNCASHVYAENAQQQKKANKVVGQKAVSAKSNFRLDKDPKYYLSRTSYQYIPMTALQAVKVNSLIGENKNPESILSPRQVALAKYVKNHSNKSWTSAINQDIIVAWNKVEDFVPKEK